MKQDWKKKTKAGGDDQVYGKVPPQNRDLEAAVLGACLLERDTFVLVADIIKTENCFYVTAHQAIYRAMVQMFNAGIAVDLMTVSEELRKVEMLDRVGGAYYLCELTMTVVSSAHVEAHARILVEKYMLREAIRECSEALAEAYAPDADAFEMLGRAETGLSNITAQNIGKMAMSSPAQSKMAMDMLEELMTNKTGLTGITSGYNEIDLLTSGWQPANLIIIAARPSVGKTAFALNLLYNAAHAGYPCAFFSMEMGLRECVNRLLSAISGVELWKLSNPKQLSQKELSDLNQAAATYSGVKSFIDDQSALTIVEFRAKARRLKLMHGIKLIIIDYLQLMRGTDERSNREQEISKISRELKATAKELGIPIIALSQLNRAVETRKDSKGPQLSDLRESGAIEQDADMVLFLTRPDYQLREDQVDPTVAGTIDVHFAKFRNGTTGIVAPLHFNKQTQLVSE